MKTAKFLATTLTTAAIVGAMGYAYAQNDTSVPQSSSYNATKTPGTGVGPAAGVGNGPSTGAGNSMSNGDASSSNNINNHSSTSSDSGSSNSDLPARADRG